MKKQIILSIFALLVAASSQMRAQSLKALPTGPKTSLRGLSVTDDNSVWVSGANGKVGRSADGGTNWTWHTVQGHEKTDFRDIEAFDAMHAVIMGISEPAYILTTEDGGVSWRLVYTDSTKGVFLDAMDFLPDGRGMAIGDPIGGRLYALRTADFGKSWARIAPQELPALEEGEAFFASSGTNIRLLKDGSYVAVTGGKRSRLLHTNGIGELPLLAGGQSTGANAIAVWQKGKKPSMVVVGGDFAKDTLREANCSLSDDKGVSWNPPQIAPAGYRSCVEFISRGKLIACGTSGVDLSTDGGMTWKNLTKEGYHVCRKAPNGNRVYLAGSGGRIAVLE